MDSGTIMVTKKNKTKPYFSYESDTSYKGLGNFKNSIFKDRILCGSNYCYT